MVQINYPISAIASTAALLEEEAEDTMDFVRCSALNKILPAIFDSFSVEYWIFLAGGSDPSACKYSFE